MLIYLSLLLFLFFVSLDGKNIRVQYLAVFIIVFIAAFRGEHVGTDTVNYLEWASQFDTSLVDVLSPIFSLDSLSSRAYEFFFNLTLYVIKFVGLPAITLQFVLVIVTTLVLYVTFKKMSVNPVASFFLYVFMGVFFFSLNGARQMCAISFLLLSFSFIGKNLFKYLTCVIAAVGIHFSSILFLPLFFIDKITITKKVAVIAILGSIILGFYGFSSMQNWAMDFFMEPTFYSSYDETISDTSNFSLNGLIMRFLRIGLIVLIILWSKEENKTVFNIFVLGIILENLTINFPGVLHRILLPLIDISLIYYVNVYFSLKKNYKSQLLFITFFLHTGYLFYYDLRIGSAGILPYYFCF